MFWLSPLPPPFQMARLGLTGAEQYRSSFFKCRHSVPGVLEQSGAEYYPAINSNERWVFTVARVPRMKEWGVWKRDVATRGSGSLLAPSEPKPSAPSGESTDKRVRGISLCGAGAGAEDEIRATLIPISPRAHPPAARRTHLRLVPARSWEFIKSCSFTATGGSGSLSL